VRTVVLGLDLILQATNTMLARSSRVAKAVARKPVMTTTSRPVSWLQSPNGEGKKTWIAGGQELFSQRQERLNPNRPISPHVTVYAFPTVAFSSVTVRITGGLLSVGTFMICSNLFSVTLG
jgi:hypothetical protein